MARLDFACGFGAVWDLIRATNSLHRGPAAVGAATRRATPPRSRAVLGDCLEALRIVALLASPVIPNAAAELGAGSGCRRVPRTQRLPDAAAWGGLPAGSPLEKGDAAVPAQGDVTE